MLDNKHIIAYLDILGFKSIIKKSTNHDYIKKLKDIFNMAKIALKNYNSNFSDDLKNNILKANITEEQKEFLLTAASRHIVFNYSKIADYYAHQSKEMQELMEESALVLIDMDDAISKGYVRLSENLQKLLNKQLEKE